MFSVAIGAVVKTLYATRWSARADAIKCIFMHYQYIRKALTVISDDNRQTVKTRAEANGLAKKMKQLETALLTVMWHTLLDRFNATSASFQKADIDLLTAVKLNQSLITFMEQMRETIDHMEIKAKSFVDNPKYKEVGTG